MALSLPNVQETSYQEIKEKQEQKGKIRAMQCLGIIYLSRIPPGIPPSFIRKYFEEYGVLRIYFAPESKQASK